MLIPTKSQNYKNITKLEPKFVSLDIDAKIIKAAKIYEAKGDVRYYLNAIYFNKSGFVAATNGHTLIKIECEECERLSDNVIIEIGGTKIPTKAKLTRFVSTSEKGGYVEFGVVRIGDIKELRPFYIIDGSYPDVGRVMPKGDLVDVSEICLNPKYIKQANDAQAIINGNDYTAITMRFRGGYTAIEIIFNNPLGIKATGVVMPCKY